MATTELPPAMHLSMSSSTSKGPHTLVYWGFDIDIHPGAFNLMAEVPLILTWMSQIPY